MPAKENKKQYDIKYAKEKLKRIPLDVQNDMYKEIKNHSEKIGETVNGFIKRAIEEAIARDRIGNLSGNSKDEAKNNKIQQNR